MKTDNEVKFDVEAELRWDPRIDTTDIAVKVNGGVVTLSGYAHRYLEKWQAEQAAKRVAGVLALANDIEIRSADRQPTDPEIARAAVAALRVELPMSWEKIKPLVHGGNVVLEGTVEWHFQRERAESAIRGLKGIKSVGNSIVIKPIARRSDVKIKIEEAFKRQAAFDAAHLAVDADGTEVTLRGVVRSWTERDRAERSAWSAPGVTKVTNNLRVSE